MQFPSYVLLMIEKLTEAGFKAFAVGGCVRDTLLGREPADWDITTSALPEETIRVFGKAPFSVRVDNGIRHGTVTVILNGNASEITTFRTEGAYSDHRRPDTVTFVPNVEDDLARRDFTVNAIAASPTKDGTFTLIDPFGGKDDLREGILRCVGVPEKRLTEDALRILRGMRFAARYGFTVEEKTAVAMHECAYLLLKIAPERIGDELRGILKAPHCAGILEDFADIAEIILPGCAANRARALLGNAVSPAVRLACLLSDCTPAHAESLLLRYGFGTAEAKKIASYLSMKDGDLARQDVLCHIADLFGKAGISEFFAFRHALSPEDNKVPDAKSTADALFTPGVCYNVATLAVSGKDLTGEGFPAGPLIGQILKSLTERVIAGEIPNDRDALLAAARMFRNQ